MYRVVRYVLVVTLVRRQEVDNLQAEDFVETRPPAQSEQPCFSALRGTKEDPRDKEKGELVSRLDPRARTRKRCKVDFVDAGTGAQTANNGDEGRQTPS